MSYIPKGSGGGQWLNVTGGALRRKIGEHAGVPQYEEYGGFSGIVTGIRTQKGEFKNRPTHELHVRMRSPESGEEVIISSTLVGPEGSVGTWAAMCISRLANPANPIDKDSHLDIGAYLFDEKNCCSVRLHGSTNALPGTKTRLEKDQLFNAVRHLQDTRYGQWDDDKIGDSGDYGPPPEDAGAPPIGEPPLGTPPPEDQEDLPF